MSANINPSLAVIQYSSQFQLLLQRMPVLANYADKGSYVGKQASPVNQIGPVNARKVTTKFAPMGRVDAPVDRRWVFPVDYDLPQLVDTLDELRVLGDPKSALVQNGLIAMGRAMDDELYNAMFGTAQTGEQGGTAVPFGTTVTSSGGNNVAVAFGAASASNLTVPKVREAKRRLLANNVNPKTEQLLMAVGPKEMDSLLSEVQVINTEDFKGLGVRIDDSGIITRILGIDVLFFNGITTGTDDASGTSHQIPVWAKSGMHIGMWNGIKTSVTQRDDLVNLPWQAYCQGTFGATRLEENKIVRIWAR